MNKVSIIIPCFNIEKYISDCLDSILKQTHQEYEIILIDSSTDSTPEIIEKYRKRFPERIKYFYQKPTGPSHARNFGISVSSGDFICFLDSDDMLYENSLEKRLMRFEKDDELSLVFTNASILVENNPEKISYKDIVGRFYEGFIFCELMINNFICTSTVLIKKEVLKKLGNFNENLKNTEDYELWLRISRNNFKFGFVDEYLTYYRIRKGSLSENNIRNVETLLNIFNRYYNNKLYNNEEEKKIIENNIKRFHSDYFIIKAKTLIISGEYKQAARMYLKIFKYNKFNLKYYLVLLLLFTFPEILLRILNKRKNHRGFDY